MWNKEEKEERIEEEENKGRVVVGKEKRKER